MNQLAGNAGVPQVIEHRLRQPLGKFHQGEVRADGDATKVLVGQATLICQGTDDGARAHMLPLAHCQPVGFHVLAASVEPTPATPVAAITTVVAAATIIPIEPIIAPVAAIIPITVSPIAALLRRRLRHQEFVTCAGLGGQGCGNIF